MTGAICLLATFTFQGATKNNMTIEKLPGGFARVKTAAYTVEVPYEWTVGDQTPWGARSINPKEDKKTELGVMTAGVTTQTWDQLYKTSLFFIMAEEKGTATPYKLSKTKTGYDACSFQVADATGFVKRRYVLLKSPKGEAIALSVKISDPKKEKEIAEYFDRMVRTAHIGA